MPNALTQLAVANVAPGGPTRHERGPSYAAGRGRSDLTSNSASGITW